MFFFLGSQCWSTWAPVTLYREAYTGLTPAVRRVGAGGVGSGDGVKGWLSLVGSRVSKSAGLDRSRSVEVGDVSR